MKRISNAYLKLLFLLSIALNIFGGCFTTPSSLIPSSNDTFSLSSSAFYPTLSSIFAHWTHPHIGDCLAKYISLFRSPSLFSLSSQISSSTTRSHFSLSLPVPQALHQCANHSLFQIHSSLKTHQTLLLHQEVQAPYLNQPSSLTHHLVIWKSSQDPTPFSLHSTIKEIAPSLPSSTQIQVRLLKIHRFPTLSYAQHLLTRSSHHSSYSFLLSSLDSLPSKFPRVSSSPHLIYLTFTHTISPLQYNILHYHQPLCDNIVDQS